MLEKLTPREREVLSLIASGMTNAQISKELIIELSTVKGHITHIFEKLKLSGLSLGGVARIRAVLIYQTEMENLKQT